MKKYFSVVLLCAIATLVSCCKGNPEPEPETVSVTGVKLNQTELTIVKGGKVTLTATVAPEDATDKTVTWDSSDKAVATVSSTGEVDALTTGTTDITVTTNDGGKTAVCTVTVTETGIAVTGVTLNKATLSLEKGSKETLTATVAPADATNQSVNWDSSDKTVATVSAAGVVEALKAGTTNVVVTTVDGEKTATCVVTVTETPAGPKFENEGVAGIDGSSWEKAYEIKTKEQLQLLSDRILGSEYSNWNNKYYKLTADIDFGENNKEVWTPIGKNGKYFKGYFDGGNHTVKGNLVAGESVESFGIIGYAYEESEIKNLHFKGTVDVSSATNLRELGGIVGYTNGVISNCSNTADLTSQGQTGGIAGGCGGLIVACYNSGDISSTSTNRGAGGIRGGGSEANIGCINSGNISTLGMYAGGVGIYNDKVIACWSNASSVTAQYPGIIVGYAAEGSKNCYWKTISGVNGSFGGTMADSGSFEGEHPTVEQIAAMNAAWSEAQPTGREYQFNATTGMIEKIK